MLRECKLKKSAVMSIPNKIELLMKHFEYSPERIAEVLATLTVRKNKVESDESIEESLMEKKVCEAQMILKLLEEKEVEEAEEKASRQSKSTPKPEKTSVGEEKSKPAVAPSEKTAWPTHDDSKSKSIGEEFPDIPSGCSLRDYTPVSQSPYWRGTLPVGATYGGKNTRSRSYFHSAGVGAAKSTSEQARAAVVAWLWEWFDSTQPKPSDSSSVASSSKKQKV